MSVIRSRRASMRASRRSATEMNRPRRMHCTAAWTTEDRGALLIHAAMRWRPREPALPRGRTERLQEEQDQRDDEHVDREGLNQHQAEQQHAADVAGRPWITRNAFGRG